METNTSDSRNLLSVSISHPEKAGSYTSRGWVNSQGGAVYEVFSVLAFVRLPCQPQPAGGAAVDCSDTLLVFLVRRRRARRASFAFGLVIRYSAAPCPILLILRLPPTPPACCATPAFWSLRRDLLRFACLYLNHDDDSAEDAVQEALLAASRAPERFAGRQPRARAFCWPRSGAHLGVWHSQAQADRRNPSPAPAGVSDALAQ